MKNNLKRIRRAHGLEQAEVARDLGIPVCTYRSWEQGVRSLKDEKLVRFVEYFGVSSDEILGTDDLLRAATFDESEGERQLLKEYRSLSLSGREIARTVVHSLLCGERERDGSKRS